MTDVDLTREDRDDLERLLAATLADDRFAITPTVAHFARLADEVDELQARRRRRVRAWAAVAAAAVVVAAVPAGVLAVRASDDGRTTTDVGPQQPADGRPGRSVLLPGTAVATTVAGGSVWVLVDGPDGRVVLQRRDPAGGEVTGEVTPPGGAPGGVTADGDRSVWVWRHTPGEPTVFTEYDARTLTVLRTVTRLARVTAAVAQDGALWFATSSEMWRVSPGSQKAFLWGGVESATAFALDRPAGVLVVASPRAVVSVDLSSGQQLATRLFASREQSLAAGPDGEVWFASSRHDGDAVVRLDPRTLRTVQELSSSSASSGPTRLAGGRSAVWLAAPDGSLTCLRPSDGRALERWESGGGSVASDGGRVAVVARGRTLRIVPLLRCPG